MLGLSPVMVTEWLVRNWLVGTGVTMIALVPTSPAGDAASLDENAVAPAELVSLELTVPNSTLEPAGSSAFHVIVAPVVVRPHYPRSSGVRLPRRAVRLRFLAAPMEPAHGLLPGLSSSGATWRSAGGLADHEPPLP